MKKILIGSLLLSLTSQSLRACDACGCSLSELSLESFAAHMNQKSSSDFLYFGLSEQYTHFGTLQTDGHHTGNPANQYEDSSITQFYLGYQITDWLGVQVNLPMIYRYYQTTDGFARAKGTVAGPGDASIILNAMPFHYETGDWHFAWTVGGGLKFPTGNPNQLENEVTETPTPPGAIDSAIGGHDLALGSGSYDGILLTGIEARWKKLFFTADGEYVIRTKGYVGYRYANEISWSAGPGIRFVEDPNYTLGVQARASGEYKGQDTLQGVNVTDTGITAVYLGPKVVFSWQARVAASFAVEIPIIQNNTGLQAVADYRLKANLSVRF
jgi:hypothetical protein